MTADSDARAGPNTRADTRINSVVHAALRRDLIRAKTALRAPDPPSDTQRVAIADHLVWMAEFLHTHHRAEDKLWLLIRQRNPNAVPLLDRMAADHSRISPNIDRVGEAAIDFRADASPDALRSLASAIDALEAELLPHLRHEEDEMMPIVAETLSRNEFDDWDRKENIAPKSRRQLGIEGHWLIDGADRDQYDLVVKLVPAIPRFVLLHGYVRSYRRACAARWGPNVDVTPLEKRRRATPAEPAPRLFRTEGTVNIYIEASPPALYEIVADVTRTGERSPECRSCSWLPGPPPGTPGARFRGHNKARHLRWSRVCEVVSADPGVEFAYRTIPERLDRTRHDSTTWSYTFAPERQGTRVTHSYRITTLPVRPLMWLYGRMLPQHKDMRPQMLHNLETLRRQAEGSGSATA